MERRKALNSWNSACAKLRKNQGYFLFKDNKGQLTLMMVDSVARAMHESIFLSPFEHYYGNEVSLEVMTNPLPRCKQCNEPIIFPVIIPPIKRAATHGYNTWRIQCILDKDLCRRCHQRNITIKDRLRNQELMIINETISTSG